MYDEEPAAPKLFFPSDKEQGFRFVAEVPTVKVKVIEPFRVVHDGKPYCGGDVAEVPANKTTEWWIRAGWVELVPVPQAKEKT